MNKGHLTALDKMHIQEILMDPSIKSILLKSDDDERPSEVAKIVQIDDDGTVRFCFGSYVWWSKLFGDYIEIPFLNFVLLVAKQLSGQQNNRNNGMWKAISQDLMERAVMQNEYSYCIDALFDVCRLGYNGVNQSKFTTSQNNNINYQPKQCNVEVGDIILNSGETLGRVCLKFKK